jgi:hypothetical protein
MRKNSQISAIILMMISIGVYCQENDQYPNDNETMPDPGTIDPSLADDPLEAMNFDRPDVSEESQSAIVDHEDEEYLKKNKAKKYLIIKLKEPSFIIDDISHGMNTVLFVENEKEVLKNKEEGEGKNRAQLIEKLKSARERDEMVETSFYFTNCEDLKNLCEEMNINPETNQVVHVSKFISTVVPMKNENLEDAIWDRIFQSLVTLPHIDALNELVEQKGPINVLLFNNDLNLTNEEMELQKERILRLVSNCKKDCFDRIVFVTLEKKDEFLERVENQGKTFLIRKGKFLLTPFQLQGIGKSYLKNTITMINNEGMDDVLINNNSNYFKIYQNEMKAIISIILNTDDATKKEKYLKEFKEAARIHREDQKNFLDRYTFVITDLKEADETYREMVMEVIGELNSEAEVFLFTRGNHKDSYENFKLSQNSKGLDDLLNSLDTKIQFYEELVQKRSELSLKSKEDNQESTLSENDKAFLEIGDLYSDIWKSLKKMPNTDEGETGRINVRNILGFMYANDISLLKKLFYKSEEEDREHNDTYLSTGLLQVTGDNLDRLIFNATEPVELSPPMEHSFILLVCRNKNQEDEDNCIRVGKMLHFLRENFPKEDAEIRIGIMDHARNDHRVVERFDIQSFPVLIFFGKKDEKRRGKIFRGKLMVEKVINWLDKKFMDNEGVAMNLTDEHYKQLLVITSKNEQ